MDYKSLKHQKLALIISYNFAKSTIFCLFLLSAVRSYHVRQLIKILCVGRNHMKAIRLFKCHVVKKNVHLLRF